MTTRELTDGVTRRGAGVVAVLAVIAAAIGGVPALAGVVAGGAVAILGFRRLAAFAAGLGRVTHGEPTARALAGGALRYVMTFAILSVVMATGWAHPLGVAAGVAVLPPLLLVQGLRASRMNPAR